KREILQWIGAVSTEAQYEKALHERLLGTCEWIFQRPAFRNWVMVEPPKPSILWIHEIPGGGKTFLSARIIEHLRLSSFISAYFFCVNEEFAEKEPLSILRGWISVTKETSKIYPVSGRNPGNGQV
ncbi:hypothetical protein K440DRAFT_552099, partial [Wilcoxina mikolae CBS 423.85]